MPLAGRPVLDWILARLGHHFALSDIVVATSSLPTDDPIASHCASHGVPVFRGSKSNVAERFVEASRHLGLDMSLRVNGDNVLADVSAMEAVLSRATTTNDWDLVSNVPGRTYGRGLSVELVRVDTLEALLPSLSENEQEHVTLRLYDGSHRLETVERLPAVPPDTNFALDEASDVSALEAIVSQLPPYPTSHVVETFLSLQNRIRQP